VTADKTKGGDGLLLVSKFGLRGNAARHFLNWHFPAHRFIC